VFFLVTGVERSQSNVVEDIASEMHHMHIGAKMLNEIQRNFINDAVSDFMFIFADNNNNNIR